MRLRLFGLSLLVLLTSWGCSGNKGLFGKAADPGSELLAVSEDRLLLVDPIQQTTRELGVSPRLLEVKALATDREGLRVFGLAESDTGVYLLRLDPDTGAVVEVGEITSEIPLNTADGMVYDPRESCLWVSAGSKGLSRFVLRVDPETGKGKRQGRVVGLPQGEVDGMALRRGVVYAIDRVPGTSYFARLAPKIVRTRPLGTLAGEVTDLTYDRLGGVLYAALDGRLAILDLEAGETDGEEVITVEWLSNIALRALTTAPPSSRLFGDDFEAGDLSRWSVSRAKTQ